MVKHVWNFDFRWSMDDALFSLNRFAKTKDFGGSSEIESSIQ